MAEMKTLTLQGTTYEITDQKARDNIGNLDELETTDKTCLVAAINEAARSGGGGEVDPGEVEKIVEDYLTENPPDTSNLATKGEVEVKADDVLFPDEIYAGTTFGAFKAGDSLQGLPLREIITKLLDAKGSIIQQIMANEIPMLSGSSDDLKKMTYSLITMTSAEAAVAPSSSGFYQIVNDGVVKESGYQLFTEATGRNNYAMAIPEGAKIVKVYMWDALTISWVDYSPVFTLLGTTTVDGNAYEIYESADSSSGEVLRFVIE